MNDIQYFPAFISLFISVGILMVRLLQFGFKGVTNEKTGSGRSWEWQVKVSSSMQNEQDQRWPVLPFFE
ncbi:MAG: hypothetical protein ACWGOY_14410 [Anaerolineales bacterium]